MDPCSALRGPPSLSISRGASRTLPDADVTVLSPSLPLGEEVGGEDLLALSDLTLVWTRHGPERAGSGARGMLLGGGAWLCSLATTLMTSWLTLSTDLLPTESYQMGLWETCVVQELGGVECRPYDSLLGLPPDIRLARILMVLTLGAGLLGLLLAIPGLHAISCCAEPNTRRHKRALKGVGGALGLVAGVVALVPVSYVAHLAVLRFFDESVPDVLPRWEFGDALFCGWAGAVLHLVGGAMLIASCLYLQRETCQRPMTVHAGPNAIPLLRTTLGPPYPKKQHQSRTKTEYV